MKFGWNRIKTEEGAAFWSRSSNFNVEKFCEVHRMSPNWPQTVRHEKYPVYVDYKAHIPKFSSLLLYDQPFSRTSRLWIFSHTHVITVTWCHACLNLGRLPWKVIACIYLMATNVLIKFAWNLLKAEKAGRMKFAVPYYPVLTKKIKVLLHIYFFFTFWQIVQK